MRFCYFYLTEKQDKKYDDFDDWADYARYVASLVEKGDRVVMWGGLYSDSDVRRVRQGQTGSVVSDVWKYEYGYDMVTVQLDGVEGEVNVGCSTIEILN